MNRNPSFSLTLALVCLVLCGASFEAFGQEEAAVTLTQISSDPFTVPPGQHATEVEPHVLANGTTLVSAFQTGRIAPGGGTAIGWATSTDGGATWANGFLPGLTTGNGGGPYSAASDPAVAYDAKHGVWMIGTLPIIQTPCLASYGLHEDWESHGFYVYELNPENRPSLAETMIARIAEVCPIDPSEIIEARPARGGIIRPNLDPQTRPQWAEAFYLIVNKTRLSYTLEAPSDFPLTTRVNALIAGVNAALRYE